MRLGEGGRKGDLGAGRTRGADGRDGNRFLVRGRADGQLVAHSERNTALGATAAAAKPDVGRAGARISRERRAVRLRAHFRDRDGFDAMANAVDVQPDLVAGRDIGDVTSP